MSGIKDWRLLGVNHCLGIPDAGAHSVKEVSDDLLKRGRLLPSFALSSNELREDCMNFKGGVAFTVQKVEQPPGNAWNEFLNDKTENIFTSPRVVRVNESIRTYVWAILGAQSQTRTGIIGSVTELDAQKQFVANVEDAS